MEVVKIEVGVDWFGMSTERTHPQANDWYYEAQEIIGRIADEGNEAEDRQQLGFVGIAIGNNFVGAREGDYYAQFSGNNAQRYWKDVYRVGAHISRLDIQCTVHLAGNTTEYGRTIYEAATIAAEVAKRGKKRGVRKNEDNNGGYSVYIGSRDSDYYACIYNKEAETKSDAYKGAWRFEVRFKNEVATALTSELFRRQNDQNDAILSTIWNWLSERGVKAPWSETSTPGLTYSCVKGKTSRETALWWLEHQVKPALDKARKLGYYSDACRALGLVEHPFYCVSRETGEVIEMQPV